MPNYNGKKFSPIHSTLVLTARVLLSIRELDL
jgi:hypothetical protein